MLILRIARVALFSLLGVLVLGDRMEVRAAPRTAATRATSGGNRWTIVYTAPALTTFEGETIGPDGALWTVDYYFQTLDRIGRDGSRKTFPMAPFYPSFITLGADGYFWINEDGSYARLARATMAGAVRFFNLPSAQFAYGGLVAGAGGKDVWFTEQTNIGRVAPNGRLRQYSATGCSVAGNGIVVGSDGKLWFGGSCPGVPDEMFKIDPQSGQETTYSIPPSLRVSPDGVVAGPDGNVWFSSNQNGGHIGRITTSGNITAFKVLPGQYPAFSYSPQNIAVGSDRNIWFIQDLGTASRIGNINPVTLRVTLYTPPATFGRMNSIIAAPNRELWITAGNQIYAFRVGPYGP